MGILNKNINFIWYGDNCESCTDFDFYSGSNIRSEFENVLRVVDVKNGGFVYTGWSLDVHKKNLEEFEKLPDIVKNTLGSNYVKNGQGFDKLECGRAYIIEIEEGFEVSVPNVFLSNINENPPRRLVNPCPTCPEKTDCGCTKKSFVFKKFDITGEEFEGWVDPQDACFNNKNGVVYEMALTTQDVVVGTQLYLHDRLEPEEFLGTHYQDDEFSLEKQYIYSENKVYLINNRTIDEIIECDDIKPTPTPELTPPDEKFCIRYSSVEKNNGTYVLQENKHNRYPVWFNEESSMYSYYENPAGATDKRWMISNKVGSKYGQFADEPKGSGPYEVTWEGNSKYYHTLVRGGCEDVEKFWIDRGNCIDGERVNTKSGDSVAINEDGTIIAFGAEKNSDGGPFAGQVRVFRWTGGVWEQMGSDIENSQVDSKFGHTISLNSDGSVLAIGAYRGTKIPVMDIDLDQNVGSVTVYKWNTTTDNWDNHGHPIYGGHKGARFGISCQLNPTGDVLVVGSSAATENITFNEEMPTPEKTPTPMPSGFDCTQDPIPDCIRIEDGFVDGYGYITHNGGDYVGIPDGLTEYSKWNNTELILDNNAIDDLFMGQWHNFTQADLLGGGNLFYRSKEPMYQDEFDELPEGIRNSEGPSYLVLLCQPVTYLDETTKNYFNNCRVYEYSLWWTTIITNNFGPNAKDTLSVFPIGNTRTKPGVSWGKWVSVSPLHTSVTQQQAHKIKSSGETITDSSFYQHPVWTLDTDSDDTWPGLNIFNLPSNYTIEEYPNFHYMRNLEFVECQSDETTIQTNENFSDDIKETSIASSDSRIPTGAVEVYNFENGNWNQLGQTIYGEYNSGFGTATCISSLSTKTDVTIGVVGDKIGEIYRYTTKGGEFIRRGPRVNLPSATKTFNIYDSKNAPSSVSLNKYGDRVAIGIQKINSIDDLTNSNIHDFNTVGQVHVFQYDGLNTWNKLGETLQGEVTALKLSDIGSTLIYSNISHTILDSTVHNDHVTPGAVYAYELIDNNWSLIGEHLYGKTHEDKFGYALDFTIYSNKIILVSTAPNHTIYSSELEDYLGQICVVESPPEFFEEIPTPVDCVFTQSEWTTCSQVCDADGSGPGTQTRTTTVISEPTGGGVECPGATIIQTCGEDRCPIDCQVSDWIWSGACSEECGGGTELASRAVIVNNQFGGVSCPPLTTQRPCNTFVCPEDCEGTFEETSPCTVSCGGGVRQLAFNVTKSEVGTGLCSDRGRIIEEECNLEPCPVDCIGSWSDWSACTASCDGGKQTRSFIVSEGEKFGGLCENKNKIETRDCNTHGCPLDCEGYYTSWSSCNSSCGGGTQTKSFVVTKTESGGGTCENRNSVLSQTCNTEPCPENCEGHWGDYGSCSKECGGGTQTRNFIVTKDELYGGICANKDGVESRGCNNQPCPRDCSGYWSTWSTCSRTCDGGTQTRNFIVRTSEAYGGVCPDKGSRESQACNTNPCPTNCEGYWSSWGACSKTCGGGTQTRSFVVTKSEANGGICTNRSKTESKNCNTQCCKQDCVGYWTDWGFNNVVGGCSKCETGQQTRKWVTTTPQSCGGTCDHYNGKTEYRNPGESVCGCCPKNCTAEWVDGPCTSEGNMNPKDNIQYIKSTFQITTPAECGGECNGSQHIGKTRYETGKDCTGGSVASYKITGFGGTTGTELENLVLYPVLWAGNGRGSNVPDLNPNNSANKIIKGPANGWYAYSCQSYADTSGGETPCRGNRKYSFRTDVFGGSIYKYYYTLKWGYSAGRVGAYNQIWNGGITGYRDWQIQNFDGSYRDIRDQYGWILTKMWKKEASFGFSYMPATNWAIYSMCGWSYQLDLNNIPGVNSPMPTAGETLVARNYKFGINRSSDYLNRYPESYTNLGFANIFGKIEKVKDLSWGSGLVATRASGWGSSVDYNVVE